MSTEEKMRAYIQRTKIKNAHGYKITSDEIQRLFEIVYNGDIWTAVTLAFNYGQAKGYRLAKKERAHV